MMRSLTTVVVLAALAAMGPAQTTGVPGVNDFTINGQTSGSISCSSALVLGGTPLSLEVSAGPGEALILATASSCSPAALIVDPTYSLDLDLASLTIVLDGTGVLLPPTFLTMFMTTNASGSWSLLLGSPVAGGVNIGVQLALFDGINLKTSQSYDLSVVAPQPICPNTIGGDLSPLSDDGSINVSFVSVVGFPFYGTSHTDVFVNMNGNLTFGLGDLDFSPSEFDMLTGAPRIAPAWDDWTPNDPAQGTVRTADDGLVFEIEWNDVRAFGTALCSGGVDSNTFCATMDMTTGVITMGYSAMLLCNLGSAPTADQVVGVSPGGLLSTATNNIDLSAGANLGGPSIPMYEDFSQALFGPFDLSLLTTVSNLSLVFTPGPLGGYDQTVQ